MSEARERLLRGEYGPLASYEVIWRSGSVETVRAHQVTVPLFGGSSPADVWVTFHGHIDGCWRLVLRALEADILSIRLCTDETAVGRDA